MLKTASLAFQVFDWTRTHLRKIAKSGLKLRKLG